MWKLEISCVVNLSKIRFFQILPFASSALSKFPVFEFCHSPLLRFHIFRNFHILPVAPSALSNLQVFKLCWSPPLRFHLFTFSISAARRFFTFKFAFFQNSTARPLPAFKFAEMFKFCRSPALCFRRITILSSAVRIPLRFRYLKYSTSAPGTIFEVSRRRLGECL